MNYCRYCHIAVLYYVWPQIACLREILSARLFEVLRIFYPLNCMYIRTALENKKMSTQILLHDRVVINVTALSGIVMFYVIAKHSRNIELLAFTCQQCVISVITFNSLHLVLCDLCLLQV